MGLFREHLNMASQIVASWPKWKRNALGNIDAMIFKTTNPDGSNKTCKFCHAEVWWHKIEGRWYNPGGEQLHVETCELRREHFHNQAMDAAESKRQSRTTGGRP